MVKPHVFVTRVLPDKGMRLVLDFCEAEVWPEDMPPAHEQLLKKAAGKDGLLTLLTDKIDAEVMEAAPRLRVISNCAVGVDNIDLAAATRRGIPVGNTPDVLTDATADMTFALLLATARRIVEAVEYVRAGKWKTWDLQLLLGADLAGRSLGIIGFGRIGRAVAKRAQGFDLRVSYFDPAVVNSPLGESTELNTLLRISDFVSLHVPLTKATHHMIGEENLRRMKSTAILVNTSRGPAVDHGALYRALTEGWIAAAALDVTEPEPLDPASPLLRLSNCLVVPHLGSASRWTREQMAVLAAENLIAGLQGRRLPHLVNPEVYMAPPQHQDTLASNS